MRLRILIELAGNDLRNGAVNDVVDLAHYARGMGVEFFVCGTETVELREVLHREGATVVDGASTSISRRGLPRYLANVGRNIALLRRVRPHVVHLNYSGHGPSLALAAYLCGIPVVVRAGPVPTRVWRRWVSAYVANGRAHASALMQSTEAPRVRVTGDLVRLERLGDMTLAAPLPPRVPGRTRFLFLGQLVERKGLHVLIEAIRTTARDFDVLMVGGNWDAPGYPAECRRQIELADLGGRVHCLNHRTDAAALLAHSDALVLPSLGEARPRVIIESMYMGRPVLASNVGGIPDLVTDGVTGLLVPPGEPAGLAAALDELAASSRLRNQLGANAQREARTYFDPTGTAGRYIDVYRELLTNRRPLPASA